MRLVSPPSMRKQYFAAINLLGDWGSMQMTVMSEGLLLNSNYIKMGREKVVSFAAVFRLVTQRSSPQRSQVGK